MSTAQAGIKADWRQDLDAAAAAARTRAHVTGISRITEYHHARLVTTALRAFGDDSRATFLVETNETTGEVPRPDLILVHPLVGVLVIENKGVALGDIHDVHDTLLTLTRDGLLREEDPFLQAEKVMFRLKRLAGEFAVVEQALFQRTAALPRIPRESFQRRFKAPWPQEALFAEECDDPSRFRQHLVAFAERSGKRARKSQWLSKHVSDAVGRVLSGTGLFFNSRKRFLDDAANANLLGAQVQQLELCLREPTHQQRTIGRSDLRGQHRLFRGVAGSGKSIMLALSAATTLQKFREERQTLFAAPSPMQRTLVVCYNKTLVPYLRGKIAARFERQTWDAISPEELTVTHFEGLVRELEAACPALRTELTFRDRDKRAAEMLARLDKLDAAAADRLAVDAIYVDEAQDLLPDEIRLLARLARIDGRTQGQTLLIFYDNAQNIYGSPLPVWQDLGVNIVGRTEFLDTCLRNTKQTLDFAFNVLVGSHAPEGQRVSTRQFADVKSLRDRKLIEERNGRFETLFAGRSGPTPRVTVYPDRAAEIRGVAEQIRQMVERERVLPSDILVLYNTHLPYKDGLPRQLREAAGDGYRLRLVDRNHESNKSLVLMEDGYITASTIASSKGYDAPIVFLLGADALEPDDVQDRAIFYVGATRAKLLLHVSGVQKPTATLLDEIVASAQALGEGTVTLPDGWSRRLNPRRPVPSEERASEERACRHCGSRQLHVQHGRFGYYYICIDCTENTPINHTCPVCGTRGKIRKSGLDILRDCESCKSSTLVHRNLPLTLVERKD